MVSPPINRHFSVLKLAGMAGSEYDCWLPLNIHHRPKFSAYPTSRFSVIGREQVETKDEFLLRDFHDLQPRGRSTARRASTQRRSSSKSAVSRKRRTLQPPNATIFYQNDLIQIFG